MDNLDLATELLKELKASAKRWFIAFCIMIGLELATIVGFMWYITLPVDDASIEIENEDGNANYIGEDGVIYNGENKDNTQTESNTP